MGDADERSRGTPSGLGVAPTLATPQPAIPGAAAMSAPAASGQAELAPGTRVGEYEIVGKLGEGGMGCVYAATHPLIGKKAAIKVLRDDLGSGVEAAERFVQEARAVNQIGHPNIVDVFSFGLLADGRRYFAMEWLQGESLGERLRRERMRLGDALDVLEQICRALEAAHAKGIIHRDLKPDNVFLVAVPNARPMVKLLDFGLAKLTAGGAEDVAGVGALQRTRTGVVMGTPLYLSPEQARGRNVGTATDVYALGVVTFEMILHGAPFIADSAMDVIAMHLHQPPPPPRSLWPEIPESLDRLILRMLEKDPAGRPACADVRAELSALAHGAGDAHAPSDVARPRSRPPVRITPPSADLVPTVAGAGLGPPTRVPTARARRLAPLVGLGLAAAAAAGVVVWRGTRSPTDPVPAAPGRVRAAASPTPALPSSPPPAPPPSGAIVVRVDVPEAAIEIDGRVAAEAASSARVGVAPGDHEVVVRAPGHAPFASKVHVGADVTLDVPVHLVRLGHPTPPPRARGRGRKLDDDGTLNPFGR